VLVATDIAARGIDIDSLEYVINFEISNMPETYVHRIGRSGRAGKNGNAISFCDHAERAYVRDIQKLIGKKLTEIEDHPFPQSEFDPALEEKKDGNKGGQKQKHNRNKNSNKNNNKKLAKRKPPKSKFSEKRAAAAEENEVKKDHGPKKEHKSHKDSKDKNQGPKSGKGKGKPFKKKGGKKGMPEGLKKKMMWPLD